MNDKLWIYLGVYLAAVNLFAFLTYGLDKYKAKKHAWRISESFLILTAVIGGSIGALLGMQVFRHKTRHKKFTIGVPLILIVQIGLVLFFCFGGDIALLDFLF